VFGGLLASLAGGCSAVVPRKLPVHDCFSCERAFQQIDSAAVHEAEAASAL